MARRSRARRRRVTTAKKTSSPYGPSNWRTRLAALLGVTKPAATPAPRRTYTPTARRTRAIGVPGGTPRARIQAQYTSPEVMRSYKPTIKPKTAVSPLITAGLGTAAGEYQPTISPATAAGSLVGSVLDPYYGGRPPWHAGRGYTPRTRYPSHVELPYDGGPEPEPAPVPPSPGPSPGPTASGRSRPGLLARTGAPLHGADCAASGRMRPGSHPMRGPAPDPVSVCGAVLRSDRTTRV